MSHRLRGMPQSQREREREQLRTSISSLAIESKQLQTKRDQLLTSNSSYCREKPATDRERPVEDQ